jgi:hypothetical protein
MSPFRIFRGHPRFDMMHLQQMKDAIKQGKETLADNLPLRRSLVKRRKSPSPNKR